MSRGAQPRVAPLAGNERSGGPQVDEPPRRLARTADTLGLLSLLGFLAVVLVGTGLTLADLFGREHPFLGFYTVIDHMAQVLALGGAIFEDPDEGYTGMMYTPGLPALLSLPHRVHLWAGWGVIVCTAALAALMAATTRLSLPPTPDRVSVAAGLGLGALALWLTTPLLFDLVHQLATDHVAWPLALIGLLCGARAHDSRRLAFGAVLLLTAAIWVKQTTVVAPAALVVWLALLALAGVRRWRFVAAMAVALVGLNAVVLGLVNLATDGWQLYYNWELPREHHRDKGVIEALRMGIPGLLPAALVTAAMWLVAGRLPPRDAPASLMFLFVALAVPFGAYTATKAGAQDNHFLGVAWALGLLMAIGWRLAREHPRRAPAASAVVAAIGAVALIGTLAGDDRLDLRALKLTYTEPPKELVAFSKEHSVYHPLYTDLDAEHEGRVYQDLQIMLDLLSAGQQPRELSRMLLARQFDGVVPFSISLAPIRAAWQRANVSPWGEPYTSGYGRGEANYLWKLERVIAARYVSRDPATGIWVRRPGPERGAWMRRCFGPFRVAGASFRVRRGGGFWCRQDGGRGLELRGTPAVWSEAVSDDAVPLGGKLGVEARSGGDFLLRHGGWALAGHRLGPTWRLRLAAGGRFATASAPARGPLVVTPAPGPPTLTVTRGEVRAGGARGEHPLQLWSTRRGSARFDLADAKL